MGGAFIKTGWGRINKFRQPVLQTTSSNVKPINQLQLATILEKIFVDFSKS